MNYAMIFRVLGFTMMYEGALMSPSLLVSVLYNEHDTSAFFISIVGLLLGGFLLSRIKPHTRIMHPREGFAAVGLIWIMMSLCGAIPFVLSGAIPHYIDAVFECASGFTTTGASILTAVEGLPHGVVFWRSFTHWVGGMGILVFTLALSPVMGTGSVHLLKAESPGPAPGKLLPKLGSTAKVLYLIYFFMTVVLIIALMLAGMPLFDAMIHAFGAAGTGGFSSRNLSVGAYQSPAIEWILGIAMILFGVNFSIYFLLLQRSFKRALLNEELRFYGIIVLGTTALIAWNTWGQYGIHAIRTAFFQVSTIITTTGYSSVDFNLWPELSRVLLVGLMLCGACAGSTGGGLKVVRLLLLGKDTRRSMGQMMHPRMVRSVKMDGKSMDDDMLHSVLIFTVVYFALICFGTMVVALDNYDFTSTLTAVISCISNIGPGLGIVGPMGNFSSFSFLSKTLLTAMMIIGRLEIFPILLLFSRENWRKAA